MLTLKEIRKTVLYKALMEIPGVELMEIDKELQAVTCYNEFDFSCKAVDGCFTWVLAPQGHHFWAALDAEQYRHRLSIADAQGWAGVTAGPPPCA